MTPKITKEAEIFMALRKFSLMILAVAAVLAGITYGGGGAFADGYFKGASLSLEGLIGVNFYVDASNSNIGGITFDVDGRDTQTINASDLTPANGEYTFTCRVSAVEMANTIRAELFDTSNQTLATQDYSVQQYVKTYFQLYSKDFSLEADDLVQAVEDYGHYTQKFLAEVKGWTLTDGKYQGLFTPMDEEAVHVLTDDEITEAAGYVSEAAFTKTKSSGVTNVDLALNLDYETSAYIYITPGDGRTLTAGNVTLAQSVWDNDEQQMKDVDFPFTLEQSGGDYVIKTGGIPAAELFANFHLTAKFDGSTEDDIDYGFSPLVYAKAVLGSDTYNDTWKNAMASLVRYSASAGNYQASEFMYANNMSLTYGYIGTAEEAFTFSYTDRNGAQTLNVPAGGQVLLYFENYNDAPYVRVNLAFLDADGKVAGNFSLYTCTHEDSSDSFSASRTAGNTTLGAFTFRLAESGGKTVFTQSGDNENITGITVGQCVAKRVYRMIERASDSGGGEK